MQSGAAQHLWGATLIISSFECSQQTSVWLLLARRGARSFLGAVWMRTNRDKNVHHPAQRVLRAELRSLQASQSIARVRVAPFRVPAPLALHVQHVGFSVSGAKLTVLAAGNAKARALSAFRVGTDLPADGDHIFFSARSSKAPLWSRPRRSSGA